MTATNLFKEEFLLKNAVSRETHVRLEEYVAIVIKWQNAINLISAATINDIWRRHILDSYQLLKYLSSSDAVLDVGTGAGFPGMVLAIAGMNNMTLVESDRRKITFLQEAARLTNTKVAILHKRVESLVLEPYSIIVGRGFAPLSVMLDILKGTLNVNHKLLLLKGKNFISEIKDAELHWSFTYKAFPSVTDDDGVVLFLSTITKKEAV